MPEKQQGKCHTLEKPLLKSQKWEKACERVERGRRAEERQQSPVALVTGVTKPWCSHQAGLTTAVTVVLFLVQQEPSEAEGSSGVTFWGW